MNGQIKVVSRRNLVSEVGWVDVYVGRASALGNPFVMNSEDDRSQVIADYRDWLWREIKIFSRPVTTELESIAALVKSGNNVRLVYWDSPQHLDVHAEVVKRCIEFMTEI